MSNRYARIMAAGGAAVLVAALAVPAALAAAIAGTWTVQPGGAITEMSGPVTVSDTMTGPFRCVSSTASGTLKSGSGLPGLRPAPCRPPASFTVATRPAPGSPCTPLACPGT